MSQPEARGPAIEPTVVPPRPEGRSAAERPRAIEETFQIPTGYGDHRIVLLVKDPWWLYAYWEIQPHRERQVRAHLQPEEVEGVRSVLRVYDVTDRDVPAQPAHGHVDITLSGLASTWYIHTNAPNRSFLVEVGLLTRQGRFLMLARSNRVTTPRFGPSEVLDEEWMVAEEDYWRLFGVTAGVGMGSSPAAIKQLLERQLASPGLFSPGLFSPAKPAKPREFWLQVQTELVVHGSTDPKASVTIQGQPLPLRPDGTFTVRMHLPDGTQAIPVQATSPDKRTSRTITPTVTRQTEGQPSDHRPQTTAKTEQSLKSDV